MHQDGMQIVKFEDLPSARLVQCHLKYLIVTDTDVEQDIVSFDQLKDRVLAIYGSKFPKPNMLHIVRHSRDSLPRMLYGAEHIALQGAAHRLQCCRPAKSITLLLSQEATGCQR